MKIQEPEDKRPGMFIATASASQGMAMQSITTHLAIDVPFDNYHLVHLIQHFSKSTDLQITEIAVQRAEDHIVRWAASLLDPPQPEAPMLSQKGINHD